VPARLNGTDPSESNGHHTNGQDLHGSQLRGRLVIASNRGSIEHTFDEQGRLSRRCASGGVATALASFPGALPITWVASAVTPAERSLAAAGKPVGLRRSQRLRLVAPPQTAYDLYYGTFCNPILWFLQHSIAGELQRPAFEREAWEAWEQGYLPVNRAFAESVADELAPISGPRQVMLHDYHLYAAPPLIRRLVPDARLQHFIHIPWPAPPAWELLPRPIVESILRGLLANDSVVFQTRTWADYFLRTCDAFLPDASVSWDDGSVEFAGRQVRVWVNPITVDAGDLQAQLASPEALSYQEALQPELGERTIVRVDRLDPAKNVLAGFRAYDRMLDQHPEWRGRARFLAFLVPTRPRVEEYRSYAREVFDLISDINARHGRAGWQPITVFHEHNRLQALAAMSLYDVLLVNPLRDGMNLVSKEGPAVNQRDGVLVLSVGAGAFAELGGHALPVLPDDVDGTARALHIALSMPLAERRSRAARLRQLVEERTLGDWLRLLLDDLATSPLGEPALV